MLTLGKYGCANTDEFPENFQRGGGGEIFNPKIHVADFGNFSYYLALVPPCIYSITSIMKKLSRAVWNFSEKSSDLVAPSFPYNSTIKKKLWDKKWMFVLLKHCCENYIRRKKTGISDINVKDILYLTQIWKIYFILSNWVTSHLGWLKSWLYVLSEKTILFKSYSKPSNFVIGNPAIQHKFLQGTKIDFIIFSVNDDSKFDEKAPFPVI